MASPHDTNGRSSLALLITLGLSLAGLAGAWVRESLSGLDRRVSDVESEGRQVSINGERVAANSQSIKLLDETLQREMRLLNATTEEKVNGLRVERVKASDDLDRRLQREMELHVHALRTEIGALKELLSRNGMSAK